VGSIRSREAGAVHKVGVYVDVANLQWNGGGRMRYDILRRFACRGGEEALRLNAYVSYDEEGARTNSKYREGRQAYFAVLREFGFKVIEKRVRWYNDDEGNRYGKANADLDMAVDLLLQSEHLDKVLIATGDGDFVQVVRALQNRGCRVEVLGFNNVSGALRREADFFMSGYLVPDLLARKGPEHEPPWGDIGARVRGVCYHYQHEKHYGFVRYLREVSERLWVTDHRRDECPYRTVFLHGSELPSGLNTDSLPTRDMVLEFTLVDPESPGQDPRATDVEVVCTL
jgi:uncharacterized LabA/DUF88 family protein